MKRVVNKTYSPANTSKLTRAKYKHLLLVALFLAMLVGAARPGLTRAEDATAGKAAATPATTVTAQVPGVLYGWGSGWLGNGTESTAAGPVAVTLPPGVSGFTAVATGELHNLALADNGKLYAWGVNWSGVLGIGVQQPQRNLPTPVVLPTGVTHFTDFVAGADHNLALGDDGKLYSWGDNYWGQLGYGTYANSPYVPKAALLPAGVTSYTKIAAGGWRSLALANNGKLYGWGIGFFGKDSYPATRTPTPTEKILLPTLAGITFQQIYAGWHHDIALGSDGKYYIWGGNLSGELGTGTTQSDGTIAPLTLPAGVTRFTQLSTGASHVLGLGDDGNLYTWGYNAQGQLGDGTTTDRSTAMLVGKGFTQIATTSGNKYNSYAFVQPATAAPVYRFYRLSNGTHFYTMDEKEKATLISQYASQMKYEGVAYQGYGWLGTNLSPVYRFYNRQTNAHFYTASKAEKDGLIGSYSQLYTFEGIAFYAQLTASDSTKPVYRFYNYQTKAHFYTANPAEKDALVANWKQLYAFEGIAFHVAS